MEKTILTELINEGLSQRQIADKLNKSQSSIKHWLKKYKLSTSHKKHNKKITDDNKKICVRCNTLKPISDFYKKGEKYHHSFCKECSTKYYGERHKNVKIKMIEYKGNECVDCGLHVSDTHPSVFDFHHLDPSTKDPNFSRIKFQSWDKIKEELDTCVLLCSNCHRIRHSILNNE